MDKIIVPDIGPMLFNDLFETSKAGKKNYDLENQSITVNKCICYVIFGKLNTPKIHISFQQHLRLIAN
jgi:hypothetical protein